MFDIQQIAIYKSNKFNFYICKKSSDQELSIADQLSKIVSQRS